jgi:hypothetical protein
MSLFAGMTLTNLLWAAGALLLFAGAMYGFVLLDRHTQAKQDEHKGVDETGLADLLALADAEDLADPATILIAASPLADLIGAEWRAGRHASDETAVDLTGYHGTHRALGNADPQRWAVRADTEQFDTRELFARIVENFTGEPLTAVGPREADVRQLDLEGIS